MGEEATDLDQGSRQTPTRVEERGRSQQTRRLRQCPASWRTDQLIPRQRSATGVDRCYTSTASKDEATNDGADMCEAHSTLLSVCRTVALRLSHSLALSPSNHPPCTRGSRCCWWQ